MLQEKVLRINQLKLPVAHSDNDLKKKVKKILRTDKIKEIEIVRRSVDARKKPELYFNYIVDVKVTDEKNVWKRCDKKQVSLQTKQVYHFPVSNYRGEIRPVIIGTGPAGLFCGYMLAKAGFRPILLERGKCIEERTEDVDNFWKTGKLSMESNVQFGEGGAGTFSDGKLNTLVKDKYGRNREVLSIFVKEGADEDILYDYKPHIGTDVLRDVIINMRKRILSMGGEIHFSAKVTGLETENHRIKAVVINDTKRIFSDYVVLAPGHSARDTFHMLYDMNVKMEAKPFAVGFRVEHPQKWINLSQYGTDKMEALGSAPYKVTANAKDGRGVYSFCMCPGGFVVNASSEEGRLAVNGMSYHARDGMNANSAIIITVTPKDYGDEHPLAGMAFQRKIEENAYKVGGGSVPIERYGDFKKNIGYKDIEKKEVPYADEDITPSVKGKWAFSPVHEILPHALNVAFVEGMEQFGTMIRGFAHDLVLVEGVESRTSSPIKILRDENMESAIKGLYPCGEGAGYAGGITSAAMDGIKVAEAIAMQITGKN